MTAGWSSKRRIDRHHCAGDRRDQLMHRRGRFDLGEDLALFDAVTDIRQLHRKHRTERTLNVVGEAEMDMPVFDTDPDMLFADFDFFFRHS